ncbi:MAG: DUF6883 domain-containing protein [Tepidisphaeraceae bacterium]
MPLPNFERAVIDPVKLANYSLNLGHDKGKHKARVFRSTLGLTAERWRELHDAIRTAIKSEPAAESTAGTFGKRYTVDFTMTTAKGSATVRSCWIVLRGQDVPRLTSCFVLL